MAQGAGASGEQGFRQVGMLRRPCTRVQTQGPGLNPSADASPCLEQTVAPTQSSLLMTMKGPAARSGGVPLGGGPTDRWQGLRHQGSREREVPSSTTRYPTSHPDNERSTGVGPALPALPYRCPPRIRLTQAWRVKHIWRGWDSQFNSDYGLIRHIGHLAWCLSANVGTF